MVQRIPNEIKGYLKMKLSDVGNNLAHSSIKGSVLNSKNLVLDSIRGSIDHQVLNSVGGSVSNSLWTLVTKSLWILVNNSVKDSGYRSVIGELNETL